MPTSNPRVNVTLSAARYAQLQRLSELTGDSMSSLVSSLIDTVPFDRTIRILEAANDAKDSLSEKLGSDLARAQAKVEKQLGLALDEMDTATGNILEAVEGVTRRARRERASGSAAVATTRKSVVSTPLSNRGVRSQAKQAKKSTRRRT